MSQQDDGEQSGIEETKHHNIYRLKTIHPEQRVCSGCMVF
jgi:hypothetical protein